jgi:hypothetical protein
MSRDGDSRPKWRSISEEKDALVRPTTRRSTLPKAPSPAELARQKKKLLLINGVLISVAAVLVILFFATRGGPESSRTPEPVVQNAPAPKPRPPAPRPAEPARPKTFRDRMREVAEREKASPKAYKELREAWSALLSDPDSRPYESSIREQIERLETAAHKEYREVYRPTYERVQDLLATHKAREALADLQGWKVPESLDIDGVHTAEWRKEMASVGELVAFEDVREKLLADFRANTFTQDAEATLAPFFKSSHFSVRNEAEHLLPELRVMRSLDLLRRKAEARRADASKRVDEVRRQIAEETKVEKGRLKAWETRMRESTEKKPIPLRALGADIEDTVRVQKYDGKEVAFAGKGFEIRLGLDEIPAPLYAQLLQAAPDPADARDLLEAGKLAVRRGALDTAQTLFDQALKADRGIAEVVPDLARIRRGSARLHVAVSITGDQLGLRYDFRSAEEAKDFDPSPETKVETGGGSLSISGQKFFYAEVGDLKFQNRLKIAAEPSSLRGSAGYILGTLFEVAPGELEHLVALVVPDRGFRVVRIPQQGA